MFGTVYVIFFFSVLFASVFHRGSKFVFFSEFLWLRFAIFLLAIEN